MGLGEQKTGHAQAFVLPLPGIIRHVIFPYNSEFSGWNERQSDVRIHLTQSTRSAWFYCHTTRGTVAEVRTPVSFRIHLSEMDPTPVQISQSLHPLNPGARVPQFADRYTTCCIGIVG